MYSRTSGRKRTLQEADTLSRAHNVSVTDWKYQCINNLREAATSKLRTADTNLGPVFVPPKSGHLETTPEVQLHPHTLHENNLNYGAPKVKVQEREMQDALRSSEVVN